jgi:tetratricopeptide (TPR) repeat protein
MKYTITTLALFLGFIVAQAQPDVTSAYSANQNGDYAKAAEYIEKALNNAKATAKEKTWRYRASIYTNIAQSEELKGMYPDALDKAYESTLKAMELDSRQDYERDNKIALANIQTLTMIAGLEDFEGEKYEEAAAHFGMSRKISDYFEVFDTLAIWNMALCYERAEKFDEAIKGYKECASVDYQVPNVYRFIATIYRNQEKDDEALATLTEARKSFPDDQGLIIDQLNLYLATERFVEAEDNLKKATALEPDNAVLWFALGSVYDNLERFAEAETAYLQALAVKADYFEPSYNLGALYFNRAVEMVNKANEIPPSQIKKYKAAIDEANLVFETALPHLEKARTLNPEDKSTLRSLKDIYIRLGMDDKYNDVKDALKE